MVLIEYLITGHVLPCSDRPRTTSVWTQHQEISLWSGCNKWITFHQICRPDDEETTSCSLDGAQIGPSCVVLRHISMTYKVAWLSHSRSSMAAPVPSRYDRCVVVQQTAAISDYYLWMSGNLQHYHHDVSVNGFGNTVSRKYFTWVQYLQLMTFASSLQSQRLIRTECTDADMSLIAYFHHWLCLNTTTTPQKHRTAIFIYAYKGNVFICVFTFPNYHNACWQTSLQKTVKTTHTWLSRDCDFPSWLLKRYYQ